MVKYINLMLQAAKHIGNVAELAMTEACEYIPNRIRITGVTEDGKKFSLELDVGECKK